MKKSPISGKITKVDFLIWVSTATTIAVVAFYILIDRKNYTESLRHFLHVSHVENISSADYANLYTRLNDLSESERIVAIRLYVMTTNPTSIGKMVAGLQGQSIPIYARGYAINISEIAGNHYKNKGMLYIAAAGYLNGVVVGQNLEHSRKILELPILENDSRTDYYLGIWWSEKNNPLRDVERARFHLERAAKQGHAGAIRALKSARVSTQ
jgi:TPR repeat protein